MAGPWSVPGTDRDEVCEHTGYYCVRLALAQFNAVVGDLAGNAQKMRSICDKAVESDVDLLVFPELGICGYPPEDLLHKKHFLHDNRLTVEQLARDCPAKTIIVGFADEHQGKTYNSAAVLQAGKIDAIYRKNMLPNYGVFDERRYFAPGAEPVVTTIGDVKIALNPSYVIDVLKVLAGEQVTLNWINEVNPMMITGPRDPDFIYIVMPIRMD